MNESEQAIAVIKKRHEYQDSVLDSKLSYETGIFRMCHNDRRDLLEIVDSQAQKIAEKTKTMEVNAAYAIELQGKIAELSALFQKAGNGAVDLAIKCAEQEMTIAKLTAENEKLKTNYSAVIATNRQRG